MTLYPGGIDVLPNPAPTDTMDVVLHAAQHFNANDAIEAIETELGVTPSGSSATVAARFGTFTADTFTGAVSFANGSAAAPSVAFASDTDTGLYRVGANSLGLSAGGAVRLTLDTAATFTGGISLTGTASVADRKITMQGTQVMFLPDLAAFPGSVFVGNGGASLAAGAQFNSAVGIFALNALTAGYNNSAVGYGACYLTTTGNSNSGFGTYALFSTTSGNLNSACGSGALYDVTTGESNVGLGYQAGRGITTGSGNTILGAGITGLAAGLANTAIIGAGGSALLTMNATGTGFNGAAVSAKPTITGSRGSNAALADLLTKLAAIGLLTDSTS